MIVQVPSCLLHQRHLQRLPILRCLLVSVSVLGFILVVVRAQASFPSSNLRVKWALSMQLLGRPHLLGFILQGLQAPSGYPWAVKPPCAPAQSYYRPSHSRIAPGEWVLDEGGLEDHLCTGEAAAGTILRASLPSSATRHAETKRGRERSPLARVFTADGMHTQRLLRIRRRNIRFLCSSRKNRMRGLLPPAKATMEEAAERHDSAEEAQLFRLMQLKDPLVDEVPIRRWRTQWFPTFARRSLVPLVQAASRCDAIVEVRDARLPLLSRCNLRVLQLPKPRVVILTHADQASPLATRQWQRHFRRESREAAALELHAELTRARKQVRTSGLLRALSDVCPLAPRLPYLFIDAREPAAIVRVQRLLRSLVKRHRRYRKELDAFRSLCKKAATAAQLEGEEASSPSGQVAQLVAAFKGATDEAAHAGEVLTKASLQQKKPLRILIVGVPNVGKSKLANCLVGRKVARSYRWPGTTQSVNLHRQPVSLARRGDMSRLFDVIDTPGFIPVHPGKGARQGQLDLGIFFDFTHPCPSPDELALLGAFHMLPHSCLFTIEEAAVALGNAFFRIRKLLPAASDLDRVMTRYKMNREAFKDELNMGVQLLLTLAEERHHSNEGAAAQRLLSDFTQGYLGRHTFELPPIRYPSPGEMPAIKRIIRDRGAGEGNNISATDGPACLSGRLQQAASEKSYQGSSASDNNNNKRIRACGETTGREAAVGLSWTMRRKGDRLSFVLDTQCRRETSRTSEECARGFGATQEARQPIPPPTNTNEHKQEHGQGYDQSSVSIANYAVGRQQQQQLLAPGWLEGW